MRRARRWAVPLLAAWLCSPGARAQGDVERAKTFFEAGAQAYASGRHKAAVEAFSEAYRLAPRPPILFSLAQAHRRLYTTDRQPEDLQKAIESFKKYLNEVPQGGRRADATEALAELELLEAKLQKANAPPPPAPARAEARLLVASQIKGATATLDGRPAGELPLLDSVAAGPHRLVISAEGHFDEARDVTAVEGTTLALDVALRPRPSTIAVAAPPGADILVDGRLVGVAPLPPVEVPAGDHTVAVLQGGRRPFVARVSTQLGGSVAVRASLRASTQRSAALITGGVALSSLVAGGIFTLAALRQQSTAQDIDAQASKGNISPAQLDQHTSARERRDAYRTGAVVTYGAGAALGLVALGLYAFDRPDLSDSTLRAPSVGASLGHQGFWGVTARGSF